MNTRFSASSERPTSSACPVYLHKVFDIFVYGSRGGVSCCHIARSISASASASANDDSNYIDKSLLIVTLIILVVVPLRISLLTHALLQFITDGCLRLHSIFNLRRVILLRMTSTLVYFIFGSDLPCSFVYVILLSDQKV